MDVAAGRVPMCSINVGGPLTHDSSASERRWHAGIPHTAERRLMKDSLGPAA